MALRKMCELIKQSRKTFSVALVIIIFDFFIFLWAVWKTEWKEFAIACISVVSAVGTGWAAIAASQSARSSNRSLEVTERIARENIALAEETLKESQATNRRNIFEQRFSLLLEQHNFYHNKVCDLIDTNIGKQRSKEFLIFNDRFTNGSLDSSLKYLTGHKVLSPYMRTLYHLLKFIDEEFFDPQGAVEAKKVYSSPLRSVIRNDILYLIAVNALNVKSESMQKSGYPKYQQLLHKFDFFEHAVFYDPLEPNVFSYDANPVNLLSNKLNVSVEEYSNMMFSLAENMDFENCDVNFISPAIICITIYKNPFQKYVKKAFYNSFLSFESKVYSCFENNKKRHDDCVDAIKGWANGYFFYESLGDWFENNEYRMKMGVKAIENNNERLARKFTGDRFVSSSEYIENFNFKDTTTGSPTYETLKNWALTIKKLRVAVDHYYAADKCLLSRKKVKQHTRQQFKNNIKRIFSYNIPMH
ncbi:putative phage abortive infection protein [Cedecea sp. MMO-103]|uniref:putative phage abortive infection protein n=1 Tax=Cedecea sp. MMO-103 TaxID=3081238 RepID=UPI0030191069